MTVTNVDRSEVQPPIPEHHCFGCGQLNETGLRLTFTDDPDGNGVISRFVPTNRVEGYVGMVHGGIISTILDEVMAWSLYRHDIWAVTSQLTTKYRKPIAVGEEIVAVGQLIADRGRGLDMRAGIRRAADGVLVAEGAATFIRVRADQARQWQERYGRPEARGEGR